MKTQKLDKATVVATFLTKPNTFKSYKEAYVSMVKETKLDASYEFFLTHFKKLMREGKNKPH